MLKEFIDMESRRDKNADADGLAILDITGKNEERVVKNGIKRKREMEKEESGEPSEIDIESSKNPKKVVEKYYESS